LSWKRRFDDPIVLPGGRQLVTLEDAGDYITIASEGRSAARRVADRDRMSEGPLPHPSEDRPQ
jgi:hypothetical protein